jgi:hypothetical protein
MRLPILSTMSVKYLKMKGFVDFHTHVFPDELAEKAMKILSEKAAVNAYLDGRISSLLSSMDSCGIEKSIVCCIATKPAQFDYILSWCKKVQSERIIPFPSIYPDDQKCTERITQIKENGFKGVKLHPYYQDFSLDEERLFPMYEKLCEANLILVMHTGFDIAFPPIRIADPEKIFKVTERFPRLKLVTTHLGAWKQWEEVEKFLLGRQIYMEISFSLEFLNTKAVRNIIVNHPPEYILFGTDSPWTGQKETLSLLRELQLGGEKEELVLRENAINLLNSA